VPLINPNGESLVHGLSMDARCLLYAGWRACKWRSASIPAGPSMIAQRDCAYGLARYAAIAQSCGLVPIVEPEVMLDGEQDIDQAMEAARRTSGLRPSSTWPTTRSCLRVSCSACHEHPGADRSYRRPREGCRLHLKTLRRRVTPCRARNHVPVWRPVRARVDALNPERDEPGTQPVVSCQAVRACAAEHPSEDVAGAPRK
jgi:fructose-bisphosphate aldolase class I